jgi:hypothetical protein
MSWQNEIAIIVRHIIDDTDSSKYRYSDSRLETTVLVASQLVSMDLDFKNIYNIDIYGGILDPDPTLSATRDNAFINLVSLKTACIIIGSEIKTEAGNAIAIKDGPSSIDLRGVTSTLSVLFNDICGKYQAMADDYKFTGETGQAILGPYSPGSEFASRSYNQYDSRGGYFTY